MKSKGKIAVFLSGRGSNFEAIYKASLKQDANFQIAVVISDKSKARGLARARELNLEAHHFSLKRAGSKKRYERQILQVLNRLQVELICLAGYMKIVGPDLLEEYKNHIINIHPALLPSFPGLHAQQQAFDHGVKVSGCTVHFVDAGVDTGPIILQQAVPVESHDTVESLSEKILRYEHKIYPQAIQMYFEDRLKLAGRKVIILDK